MLLGMSSLDGSVSLAALSGLFKPENALLIAVLFLAGPGAIVCATLLEGNIKERVVAKQKEFRKPKGMEDYFPKEQLLLNDMFDRWRKIAVRYGFQEVSSPAMESLSLLTEKEGEEIKEQIFVLEKRSKEEFGLRFDLTVPCARMFLNKQKALSKPVKWFYLDRMWRYERPQAGRLREFYQFGIETFGSKSPVADAEVVDLAIEALLSLGFKEKDFTVFINNRKMIQGLLLEVVPEEKMDDLLRLIDKRRKIEARDFKKDLKELGVKKTQRIF